MLPPFEPAAGELSCDVCVIGGGYTGLSSALHLAQKGYDVILLDAHRVGWGASGRNGGQVGTGQRVEQGALEHLVGLDQARELWEIACQSVQCVTDLIDTHKIECDYASGIIHADHRQRFVAHTHRYADKLSRDYGYDLIEPLDQQGIRSYINSDDYYGGWLDHGSGHMHPLKFALGLATAAVSAGVRLFEKSRVTSLQQTDPAHINTDRATITARYVVLGCNGYLVDLDPSVAAHVMPVNNYMIATKPLGKSVAEALIRDNHAVADSRFVVNYFRLSDDDRLLFGGGESYGYRFPANIEALVRKPMRSIFPQLESVHIDYAWGGTLGITMNRMPHLLRLQGNILSASGYSGHGVAMATLTGCMVADAIDCQAGKFDIMADVPTPRFPGGMMLRSPLLALGMTWFSLRDRL